MRMIGIAGMVVLAGCVAQPVQQAAPSRSAAYKQLAELLTCTRPETKTACECITAKVLASYDEYDLADLHKASLRAIDEIRANRPQNISHRDLSIINDASVRSANAAPMCGYFGPMNMLN